MGTVLVAADPPGDQRGKRGGQHGRAVHPSPATSSLLPPRRNPQQGAQDAACVCGIALFALDCGLSVLQRVCCFGMVDYLSHIELPRSGWRAPAEQKETVESVRNP